MVAWDKTLRDRVSDLTRASETVAQQLDGVGDKVDQGTRDLMLAARQAQALNESLDTTLDRAHVDDFMRRSAFITEKLQSLAVDLARIVEVPITEDDWRRFNKGEKGVFVRKMLGFKEKNTLVSIKAVYQDDGEFRDYVGRYVSEFDAMMDKARERDHDGVLESTFLSSDMGKLYMVLSKALGRDL